MISKWMVQGILVAGVFASYDCRRRHGSDDNGTGTTATTPITTPQVAVPPVLQGMQPVAPPLPNGLMPLQQQPAGDYIAQQMALRQGQFAQGMNPVMPLTRGTLATSAAQNYAVQIQPGHCYKIIGVGSTTVTDLDLKLFDPTGIKIDEDVRTDNYPVIGLDRPLCPTTPGAYRLEVLMYQGTGDFGVQVFSN